VLEESEASTLTVRSTGIGRSLVGPLIVGRYFDGGRSLGADDRKYQGRLGGTGDESNTGRSLGWVCEAPGTGLGIGATLVGAWDLAGSKRDSSGRMARSSHPGLPFTEMLRLHMVASKRFCTDRCKYDSKVVREVTFRTACPAHGVDCGKRF
jgi:hypothetical protein